MATLHGEDEAAVIEALRAGDRVALDDVYARWSPVVYSLALRCLGDVGKAEEVTRRVFAEVWASRHTIDPTRSHFSAWLVGLTRSRLLGAAGPARPAGSVEQSPGVESRTAVLAERVLLAAEMSHLDTVTQRVLRMALDDGLSHVEVAERTGLPVEEVRRHIASSLIELRQWREVGADAH